MYICLNCLLYDYGNNFVRSGLALFVCALAFTMDLVIYLPLTDWYMTCVFLLSTKNFVCLSVCMSVCLSVITNEHEKNWESF